jgi:hypothetical protein
MNSIVVIVSTKKSIVKAKNNDRRTIDNLIDDKECSIILYLTNYGQKSPGIRHGVLRAADFRSKCQRSGPPRAHDFGVAAISSTSECTSRWLRW